MDGNGRWAKKRGFLRTNGHEAGANVVSDMCEFCIDNGVKILSLYAFSTENWKRPQKEVDFLMNLLKKFLLLKRNDFIKNGIKFNTIGNISPFSDELKNEIEITKDATRENTNLLLNLAINYGSKDEIIRAVKKLNLKGCEINEASLNAALDESQWIFSLELAARVGFQISCSGRQATRSYFSRRHFGQTLARMSLQASLLNLKI